ncbi:hypothetical protein JOB18_024247 [Solea senegalensis]|uniref:DUF4549 domain-containing protein n=2 Tax=Solea senegalensis TaxID=28829 RepID=A0AAV6S0W4_SOLSE|nr:uncharacterized protein si:ch73-242m19.1 isoform X1 [Solea senegalensis]KAG7510523.1 hypothetical protein JOB18_024247 [Solea senegalensis]
MEQMEAELSHQISALHAEIKENGFQQGAGAFKTYSSVLPPKDISFFRVERERALRRGLQVAEALPVHSHADVMHRELESCLTLEHMPDNLPLLLHQFYVDRSYHLAQVKYLLMLRWRRFCRHSSIIEKLYPHYRDQVSYITCEYEHSVQRARRLSASTEKILTAQNRDSSHLLTQDDVVIYLRWLLCHLHSIRTIHSFLTVLHYIPACERKDKGGEFQEAESLHQTDGLSGQAENVPLLSVHLQDFLPELQSLLTYFHLSYDTGKLRTTADEMEMFSTVWREFRTMFRQQEQMRTFPWYDSAEVEESQWGRKSGNMALRKEANWIPFIQVKPRQDPWQQKTVTRLRENKCVDELLRTHCSFLQVSDLHRVASALKDHAAHVCDPQSTLTSCLLLSHCSKTKRQKISDIWRSIYSSTSVTQETQSHSSRGTGGNYRSSTSQRLQLVDLDDSLEEDISDPIVTKGAHLSLVYLRHLKLRELQRVSLAMLNYLRSVERTLTFELSGLQREDGELLSTAEETGWMNAARGGRGEAGGLGSLQFNHNTPVDYKVHCSEFMEFAEVENLHDFYSTQGRFIHTQDQRGFYIVYDAALNDLDELENELLLVGSHFLRRNTIQKMGKAKESATATSPSDLDSWAGAHVDRVAVLLDLWSCETEFLESKVQLLNCYYEAYQHSAGTEERFTLARVITDIMHSRPQLDLNQDYFIQAYRAEIDCLRSHQQLIKNILDNQIEKQRLYLQRVWRGDDKGSIYNYGLPLNYVPKHSVSLGGSSPALMNTFLLEVHPSLCLASAVHHGLVQAHTELCQLRRATSVSDKLILRQKLLRQALQSWSNLASPGASYGAQIQKDLFSGVFFEDPGLVLKVGLTLNKSKEEMDVKQGREKQSFAVDIFSKLLELITIRHRLLESASETAHLAQLYKNVASELGLDEFHLYLRPVKFEDAEEKDQTEATFITATRDDDTPVDRFTPSHLPLSVQELNEDQIGKFSFASEDAVLRLMNTQSVENLQVTLACQVAQKNALISAVKVACLCHWAGSVTSSAESGESCHFGKDVKSATRFDSKLSTRTLTTTYQRQVFVSIQLEKVCLRDEMLNSFMKKKQAVGGRVRTSEEEAKIRRSLIIDFLRRFSAHVSQYCVRAQIVAYYYSLTSLLDDVPSVRQSHFMTEQTDENKGFLNFGADICSEPSTSRRQLLSADGNTLVSLWVIPHFSEVLHMFRTLEAPACAAALHHTLHIVSALHDIVCYLVSFSRLGNTENSCSWRREREAPGSRLAADWGGAEGIGAELLEIQRQIERLSDPSSPASVGRLLQLRRQVLLLQFDTAVRLLIREAFLSSGDVASYQSVSDNMKTALPLLSDTAPAHVFSVTLPVPRPLDAGSLQAQRMYSWRSFIASHGLFPLRVWDLPPIEYCMQVCLSGLKDCSRLQANAAILGVSLLLEDVLNSGRDAEPVRLYGNKDGCLHDGQPHNGGKSCSEAEVEEKTCVSDSTPLQDPVRMQSVMKGFLLLTKQLQVFKENWAQRRLGPDVFSTPSLYQQFVNLYRAEIFYPSMKALALTMGKERDYEVLISGSQSFLPPPGASETDVKAWQLHRLLESTECDMIKAVQRRINTELSLAVSERTRHDTSCLPTDLWKKVPPKHSLSPERPQIVETFVKQLMEGEEQVEGQVKVSVSHLQTCLTHLGSALLERERRSFLLYSHFYEQILQQETLLLHQTEQDLKDLKELQTKEAHREASFSCREMMLEISALQAQVAHLQDEKRSLEEQLGLKFKERYNHVVRQLVSTCIQLQTRLDDHQRQTEQDVSVMVSRIREEGVARMMKLKEKYGCTTDNDALTVTQAKKEEVQDLSLENSQLTSLLCKLKALSRWRQVVEQEKLHRRLLQTQQREIISRTEAVRVKTVAEEEVIVLREELDAARRMLNCSQDECSRTKKLLSKKTEELQAARHQSAQEARSRREVDTYRLQNLQQMRADMEDRDRQLRDISEQLDRDSKMSQFQRQRSAKEIRQVKGQLHQERCLKQEAFQQVDKLQNQVNDIEAAFSRSTSTIGQSRTAYMPSVSRWSTRSPSAGLHRLTNSTAFQELTSEQRRARAETTRSRSNARINRPTADPSRLRVPLPEL